MLVKTIRETIEKALRELGVGQVDFAVEHPADPVYGDYSTNVAMVLGKETDKKPKDLAEKIVRYIVQKRPREVENIAVAGSGFINFYLSRDFFANSLEKIQDAGEHFGTNDRLKGQKVLVEYTDPNPFKEFHIGHLMNNAIGEALSRLVEASGAEVKRANYQGDVGLHVAKAIWGKQQNPYATWGAAYAIGARAYDEHKEEMAELNKHIYERDDEEVNALYDQGRAATLEKFEKMYEILDTKFDEYFFESEVAEAGKKIVEENTGDVFTESNGAVVFSAEKSGLHTRVFLNSQSIPTYEAKELALAKIKYKRYPYDHSIAVIGNEVDEYFKVVHKAMRVVYPELAAKTKHLSHGMLRLTSGKMSSRTGDVITAESLITDVQKAALEKMSEKDEYIAEQVAIGALKYEILKQSLGKDIVFDPKKALSLEGDSGPYLQYTLVRAQSVLAKARSENLQPETLNLPPEIFPVERLLYRFPEVVDTAAREYEPQKVVHFLLMVASSFNTFYSEERIVGTDDVYSPFKIALTKAVAIVLENGLIVLGIPTPERM